MTLVFMDFDGTITKKDTFIEFIRFYKPFLSFCLGFFLLSPIIIGYKLKLIPNYRAKELVFSYFFKGTDESLLLKEGEKFANNRLPILIRKVALAEIKKHQENGAKVVIVTASFPIWIKSWSEKAGFDLIATGYEVENGKITGKLKGENCFGKEKPKRIKELFDLSKVEEIYAYGDSKGDIEMLNIADVKFMKWRKLD